MSELFARNLIWEDLVLAKYFMLILKYMPALVTYSVRGGTIECSLSGNVGAANIGVARLPEQ